MAEHVRDAGPYEVEDRRAPLLGAEGGQPAAQRPGVGVVRAGGAAADAAGDQGGQQRRHWRGTGGRAQPGEVELDGDEQRFVRGERRVEERQALVGGERGGAASGHPPQVAVGEGAGQGAAFGPQAPGQGLRGAALGAAPLGEGVEEGVGRGVVALPGVADGGGRGGEQDEGGEAHALGEFVEVEGRVDLGAQHVVHALRGQRFDERVVEDARGVYDGGEGVFFRYALEQCGERRAVRDVARGDAHPRARFPEFGGEGERLGGVGSAPARQKKVPDAVFGDEVTGHQGTEHSPGSGDQDGLVGVPRGGCGAHGLPYEPGREQSTCPRGELRFATGERGGQSDGGARRVVGVEEEEAAGMLGLRREEESAYGRGGEVGDLFAAARGDGAVGEQDQAGFVPAGVSQPFLGEGQNAVQRGSY